MEIIDKYFKDFGDDQRSMAASVESLQHCKKLIEATKIDSILDAGSGLTSAFFHSHYANVTTIDDDEMWAGKTRQFISANLNKEVDILTIADVHTRKYDFIYYDYGHIETRIYYFRHVLNMCTKILYLDDMHVSFYRDYIKSRGIRYDITILPETTDQFGRYGALIVKDPGQ